MVDSKSHASLVDGAEQRGHWPLPLETETRLGAALSIAKLGTFEWNLATNSVLCDERSREIFGFSSSEGCTIREVSARIHRDDLPRVERESEWSRENLSRLETEYRVVLPDGSIRNVASITHAIAGHDGKAEHMFGVLSDITERKQAEALLSTTGRAVAARTGGRYRRRHYLRSRRKHRRGERRVSGNGRLYARGSGPGATPVGCSNPARVDAHNA